MSGPAPGTGCAVCEHPDHTLIEADIASGLLSNRRIAAKYGMGKDSVGRHVFKRHSGDEFIKSRPDGRGRGQNRRGTGGSPDGSELDKLIVLRAQLEGDMATRPRAETSRELRQVNQRIAELRGADKPKNVTVADVRGLAEQIARWFKALEPYPEAREAMLAVTDRELLDAAAVE